MEAAVNAGPDEVTLRRARRTLASWVPGLEDDLLPVGEVMLDPASPEDPTYAERLSASIEAYEASLIRLTASHAGLPVQLIKRARRTGFGTPMPTAIRLGMRAVRFAAYAYGVDRDYSFKEYCLWCVHGQLGLSDDG